jgi:signal transduction histidine kinase
MIQVIAISLENEMDLILAHKRSMRVAEKIGLTVATQTTFATAVSEICRTVIEQTDKGQLAIGLRQNKQRYSLQATITFDSSIHFTNADAGFYYAQKLVPEFAFIKSMKANVIEMNIGLPQSLKLDPLKIGLLKNFFKSEGPINAYEEIKLRNVSLNKVALEKEEEIRRSKIINEKKTEFISIASHEIKTPITIIKAYTQVAKRLKGQCSPQVQEILDKVDLQTTKLLTLVQQLLDISKIENGSLQYNKEDVELNAFIIEMVNIIQLIYPNHLFTTSLCQDMPVSIDRIRMEQVFSNLIGNAAKYSAKSTTIHIACEVDKIGYATVSVSDKGIGMSATTIKSIFDKFYRNEDVLKTHSGLGMGLYVASKIVSDHNGKIWVTSVEGSGSTFYLTIPLSSEAPSLTLAPSDILQSRERTESLNLN